MPCAERHIFPALLAGASVLMGCARDDEASMRDRLSAWFILGDTLAFASERGCAAGAFLVKDDTPASGLPVERDLGAMLRSLPRFGVAAVDDPALSPDEAMRQAANTDRPVGMAMRRAALEARDCMQGDLGAEFRRLLTRSEAVLAYHSEERAVMMLDRPNRVLVVAMGAGE